MDDTSKSYQDKIFFGFDTNIGVPGVSSVGIGDCWLYFYYEVLIGVVDPKEEKLYMVDPSIFNEDGFPNAKYFNPARLEDAFMDTPDEWEEFKNVPIDDLVAKAKELIAREIA